MTAEPLFDADPSEEAPRRREGPPPTVHGLDPFEAISWLQKAWRRGLDEDALWVAAELDKSGYGSWVWKRLKVICSEDVGLAEPTMPSVIAALH